MAKTRSSNPDIPSFFSKYEEIFCLPIFDSEKYDKNLLNKIIFLLRQAGCRYWVVKGSSEIPATGKQDCLFLFARNERAVQGFDYFRYLFFYLGQLLQSPVLLAKFPDSTIHTISCSKSSGKPISLQWQINAGELDNTASVLSASLGQSCTLESVLSEAHSFEGMNGSLMRAAIRRKLSANGIDGLYKILELDLDNIPHYEPVIYTQEQEPMAQLLIHGIEEKTLPSLDKFFVAKKPIYCLTAHRDDRSLIDNVKRQTMLEDFLHEAGLAIAAVSDADSNKKLLLVQNFLNFGVNEFIQMFLEATLKTLDGNFPVQEVANEQLTRGEYSKSAFWLPDAGLVGACQRDRIREVIRHYTDNFGAYIGEVCEREQKSIYRDLVNKAPEGTPAHTIIDFLNKPHRCFCVRLFDKSLSASENSKSEKELKKILEAGDFSGFILNNKDNEGNHYPAYLFATQESLSDNTFVQLLISFSKAYGQQVGIFKSTDGYFFSIPTDMNKAVELVAELPLESMEKIDDLINSIFEGNFKLSNNRTLTTLEAVQGFSGLERRAKFLRTTGEYGENGIAKLLGQDIKPLPFTKNLVGDWQPGEKKVTDSPYFIVK